MKGVGLAPDREYAERVIDQARGNEQVKNAERTKRVKGIKKDAADQRDLLGDALTYPVLESHEAQ